MAAISAAAWYELAAKRGASLVPYVFLDTDGHPLVVSQKPPSGVPQAAAVAAAAAGASSEQARQIAAILGDDADPVAASDDGDGRDGAELAAAEDEHVGNLDDDDDGGGDDIADTLCEAKRCAAAIPDEEGIVVDSDGVPISVGGGDGDVVVAAAAADDHTVQTPAPAAPARPTHQGTAWACSICDEPSNPVESSECVRCGMPREVA